MKTNNTFMRIASAFLALVIAMTTVIAGNVTKVKAASAPQATASVYETLDTLYKNPTGNVSAEASESVEMIVTNRNYGLSAISSYATNVKAASQNERVVKASVSKGWFSWDQYEITLEAVGEGNATVYVASDLNGITRIRKIDVKVGYGHIDVRVDGVMNLIEQVNGVVDQSKSQYGLKATITSVTGTVNGTTATFSRENNSGENEFRTYGVFNSDDNVILTLQGNLSNGKTFTYTHKFTKAELQAAYENCKNSHPYVGVDTLGFDIDLNADDITNRLTHTVTVKYVDENENEIATAQTFTGFEGATTSFAEKAIEGYTVAENSKGSVNVTVGSSDSTVKVHYTTNPATYTVIFKNIDGEVIDSRTYTAGAEDNKLYVPSNAKYPLEKDIYTHGFVKYADKNGNTPVKNSTVTADAVYIAQFSTKLVVAYYKYNKKVDTTQEFYDQDGIDGRPTADFTKIGSTMRFDVGQKPELEAALTKIFNATKNNTKPGTIAKEDMKTVIDLTKTTAQENAVDAWYVLKQESDGWHIDGGDYNVYPITVKYVDTDKNVLKTLETVYERVGSYKVNAQDSKLTVNGRDYVLGENAEKNVELTKEGLVVTFEFKKVFKIYASIGYTNLVPHYADQKKGIDYYATVVEGEDASNYLSPEALKAMETTYAGWLDKGQKFAEGGFKVLTEGVNITSMNKDVWIKANRENIKYTVTFYDMNGEDVLATKNDYNYGNDVVLPENVVESFEKEGVIYTFTGWDKEVAEKVTESAEYVAQYDSTAIDYTVVFNYKNEEGEDASSEQSKRYNDEADVPETPDYEDDLHTYTFEAWTTETENGTVVVDEIPAVTGDATYTATYTATLKQFTVTYIVDEKVVDTKTVDAGSDVAALLDAAFTPAEGFTFSGWTTDETNKTVLRDVTITGTTKLIPAPVVEADEDEVEEVVPGKDVEPEKTPAKEVEVEGDEDVVKPAAPAEKETVAEPEKPAKTVEVEADVTTADGANVGLLVSLLSASVILLGAFLLKKRSSKKEA